MRRRRLSRAASPERTIPSARSPSWTRATPWRARTRRCWRRLARTTCPRTRRSWSTRVGSASAPTRTRPCSGSPRKASPRPPPGLEALSHRGRTGVLLQLRHRGERLGPPVRRHSPNQGGGGAREARRRARGRLRFLVRLPGRQRGRLRRRARQYRRRQPPRLARRRAAHPSQRRVLPSKQPRRRRAVRVPEATRRAGHAISATRRRTRPARHAFPSRRAGPKHPERRAKRPQASRRRRDARIARSASERPSRTRSRRSVGEKRCARARARARPRSIATSISIVRARPIDPTVPRGRRAAVVSRCSPRGIPSTETFVGVEPRGRRGGRRERRRRERGRVRDDGGVVRDGRILGRVVRSKRHEREKREAFARGGGGESRENRRGARGRRRRRRYPRRERVHRGRGCGLAPGIPRARRRHETTIPRVEERSVGGRSRNRSVRGWRRAFGAAGDERAAGTAAENRNRNRNDEPEPEPTTAFDRSFPSLDLDDDPDLDGDVVRDALGLGATRASERSVPSLVLDDEANASEPSANGARATTLTTLKTLATLASSATSTLTSTGGTTFRATARSTADSEKAEALSMLLASDDDEVLSSRPGRRSTRGPGTRTTPRWRVRTPTEVDLGGRVKMSADGTFKPLRAPQTAAADEERRTTTASAAADGGAEDDDGVRGGG